MLFKKKAEEKTNTHISEVDFEDENRDIQAEVDAMMKKFDLESNTRIWEGRPKWVVMTISALFAAYCIWSWQTESLPAALACESWTKPAAR